jgi:hypothetical protein
MSIVTQPGVEFIAWLNTNGRTGLVGNIELGIIDGNGDYLPGYPADPAQIVEADDPGVYAARRISPPNGQYAVSWTGVPGFGAVTEELIVTPTGPGPTVGGGRSTMAGLISLVRSYSGDLGGLAAVFTDVEVQQFLDAHRRDAVQLPLEPVPLASNLGGEGGYFTWTHELGWWEDDAAVVDANFIALTPSSVDLERGRWVFTAAQSSVYLTGATYDVWHATADLLTAWAARLARRNDFSVDGNSYSRSQQAKGLADAAERALTKARLDVLQISQGWGGEGW